MKLLTRYNRLNISATIVVFLVGSVAFYFLLRYILVAELDETLLSEQQETTTYVKKHHSLPEIIPTSDQYTTYETARSATAAAFSTLKNHSYLEGEMVRELRFTIATQDGIYLVRVEKPLDETEDLLRVIVGVTVLMIAIILLTGYFINRRVIGKLWRPFYSSIDKVKNYHLAEQRTMDLERSDIYEFELLNQSVNEMVGRIRSDYDSLKDFTGQAAHEMQTPLAIIRARMDTLVQNEAILENNATHITDIEKAVQRLSRLHQSLLLLTKVENRQFTLDEETNIEAIVKEKYDEYLEMAASANLEMTLDAAPLTVKSHQHLAEIMVGNLLNNAIRYNEAGGAIAVVLRDRKLLITNTSANQPLDENKLFRRFYRQNGGSEGNGLGLSIVKQICDLAGYSIAYSYADGKHTFAVIF